MRDMGMLRFDEPFTRLFTQGMLLNHIWLARNDKGGVDHFPPQEVTAITDAEGRIAGGRLADGTPVEYGGIGKMSKSERNGVDPQEVIDRYGADTARLFVMFAGPPVESAVWSDSGVEGQFRFLRRLWTFAHAQREAVAAAGAGFDWREASDRVRAARREIHQVLSQANYDYERLQYNTVVSAAMKMLNTLEAVPPDERGAAALVREGLSILVRVIYPVAPHATWTLWSDLGYAADHGDLLDAPWPEVDPAALEQSAVELVLQVNGKLRGKLVVPASADAQAIESAARAAPEVAKHAAGAPVRKVIVVPGRLVNVVV
jgi:leucyl-tRNA synthetase